MEILKEAQTAVNFASYYPLLHKATSDNDTPCPGYAYEEIIKLSYVSGSHRTHLVDFLLSRLQVSSCSGKQKVVNVLRHLTQKGHPNIRSMMRLRDMQLRAIGGPTHNAVPEATISSFEQGSGVIGDSFKQQFASNTMSGAVSYTVVSTKTPQLLLQGAVQDLLLELFDPQLIRQDEEKGRSGAYTSIASNTYLGMGSSSASAGRANCKYQGFGSNAFQSTSPTVVDKVRGLVDRMLWPDVKELSPTAKAILKPDYGNYVPYEIPTQYLADLAPLINPNYNITGGSGSWGRGSDMVLARSSSSGSGYHSRSTSGGVSGNADAYGNNSNVRSSPLSSSSVLTSVGNVGIKAEDAWATGRGGGGGGSLPRTPRTGRAHQAGKAGGGWDDEDNIITGTLPSAIVEDSPALITNMHAFTIQKYSTVVPPTFDDVMSSDEQQTSALASRQSNDTTVVSLSSIQKNISPNLSSLEFDRCLDLNTGDISSREEKFMSNFFSVCSIWPVPFDVFMDLCTKCTLLDSECLLEVIAATLDGNYFRHETEKPVHCSKSTTSDSTIPCEISCNFNNKIDAIATSELISSPQFHHQMALLTLVDFCMQHDFFSPVLVKRILGERLQRLQNDNNAEPKVVTRAKRLTLMTTRSVEICESRVG